MRSKLVKRLYQAETIVKTGIDNETASSINCPKRFLKGLSHAGRQYWKQQRQPF
jgi:hypothetical protein